MSEKNGVKIVKYGTYPQMVPPKAVQILLNRENKKTNNTFTIDSRKYDEYDKTFAPQVLDEIEYNGKRYIKINANSCFEKKFKLSNGEEYKNNDPVWVEVTDVYWYDLKSIKTLLPVKGLFAGVQFHHESNYKGDFDRTDIKYFLDNHFEKDLLQEVNLQTIEENPLNNQVVPKKTRVEKMNPDETLPTNRRKMTDTEVIHTWIEAGHSVLLRGPSGIGKTERIKSLYPDLIYIKLTNNMFPEKVVGSINLQTGESIPPDFAKQAIMACATEEERKLIGANIQNIYKIADEIYERSKNTTKKIVILLDELLNVKPIVQSLVYTLVLNRIVEIGGGLKLPANTVIVATGNQKKYSNIAEDLAEPLEKRFDHILDMQPKVGEWIYEYAIPNKVHPMVISFILSNYLQNEKSEEIENMGYFYEEPEIGEQNPDRFRCNGRTNDPRGWVSISNTLYAFESDLAAGKFIGKDVEALLQISIGTKLREEWALKFYDFYNIPILSIKEVVSGNYTQEDLPRNINERFAYISSLILADEKEVGPCRDFIRKYCDPEYLKLYDICWIGNDMQRMEKIMELQVVAENSLNLPKEEVSRGV